MFSKINEEKLSILATYSPAQGVHITASAVSEKLGETFDTHIIEKKDPRFVYAIARAVTADVPNKNHDMFPLEEIKKAYTTFIGRNIFLDHNTKSVRNAVGKIVAAELREDEEGHTYVACLFKIDRELHPDIARKIENGIIDSVSMGANVQTATCSLCGQSASRETDFCCHMKNMYMYPECYSINNGVEFTELSLVSVPADPTAKMHKVFGLQNGIEKIAIDNDGTNVEAEEEKQDTVDADEQIQQNTQQQVQPAVDVELNNDNKQDESVIVQPAEGTFYQIDCSSNETAELIFNMLYPYMNKGVEDLTISGRGVTVHFPIEVADPEVFIHDAGVMMGLTVEKGLAEQRVASLYNNLIKTAARGKGKDNNSNLDKETLQAIQKALDDNKNDTTYSAAFEALGNKTNGAITQKLKQNKSAKRNKLPQNVVDFLQGIIDETIKRPTPSKLNDTQLTGLHLLLNELSTNEEKRSVEYLKKEIPSFISNVSAKDIADEAIRISNNDPEISKLFRAYAGESIEEPKQETQVDEKTSGSTNEENTQEQVDEKTEESAGTGTVKPSDPKANSNTDKIVPPTLESTDGVHPVQPQTNEGEHEVVETKQQTYPYTIGQFHGKDLIVTGPTKENEKEKGYYVDLGGEGTEVLNQNEVRDFLKKNIPDVKEVKPFSSTKAKNRFTVVTDADHINNIEKPGEYSAETLKDSEEKPVAQEDGEPTASGTAQQNNDSAVIENDSSSEKVESPEVAQGTQTQQNEINTRTSEPASYVEDYDDPQMSAETLRRMQEAFEKDLSEAETNKIIVENKSDKQKLEKEMRAKYKRILTNYSDEVVNDFVDALLEFYAEGATIDAANQTYLSYTFETKEGKELFEYLVVRSMQQEANKLQKDVQDLLDSKGPNTDETTKKKLPPESTLRVARSLLDKHYGITDEVQATELANAFAQLLTLGTNAKNAEDILNNTKWSSDEAKKVFDEDIVTNLKIKEYEAVYGKIGGTKTNNDGTDSTETLDNNETNNNGTDSTGPTIPGSDNTSTQNTNGVPKETKEAVKENIINNAEKVVKDSAARMSKFLDQVKVDVSGRIFNFYNTKLVKDTDIDLEKLITNIMEDVIEQGKPTTRKVKKVDDLRKLERDVITELRSAADLGLNFIEKSDKVIPGVGLKTTAVSSPVGNEPELVLESVITHDSKGVYSYKGTLTGVDFTSTELTGTGTTFGDAWFKLASAAIKEYATSKNSATGQQTQQTSNTPKTTKNKPGQPPKNNQGTSDQTQPQNGQVVGKGKKPGSPFNKGVNP